MVRAPFASTVSPAGREASLRVVMASVHTKKIARGRASLLLPHAFSPVVCCVVVPLFVCSLGTLECWGGRQGGCGLELCVRLLRVCGSQLAVCLVSLFVSVCRSCVSSSSVQRPPIPRWCPVRAWLFFTLLPTYLPRGCARMWHPALLEPLRSDTATPYTGDS